MNKTPEELLSAISQAIFDKKGCNIIAIDVRGLTSFTDFFLIAEGSVDRQVKALGDEVIEVMKKMGQRPLHVEGDRSCDWLLLDYGNIVVHLFIPSFREKYEIEKVWQKGKIVDLPIVTGKKEL